MHKLLTRSFWIGAIGAAAASFCLIAPATTRVAYLPIVGVPPMRFGDVYTNDFNYSKFKLEYDAEKTRTTPAVVTNAVATEAATTPAKDETLLAKSPPPLSQTPGNGELLPESSRQNDSETEKEAAERGNFAFPTTTASDLLTVTPQMIAQYLKPDSNATNALDRPGAVVFVPADMSFTPPTPKASPSSQANYHSP